MYSKRTRNAVNKIYEAKTQDHLGTHQAIRRVAEKPGTTPLTTEFLAYHLTVEQQDTSGENKVKKLIEKFENHQHKESFLQNLSQTQKINKFSKESKELVADMNNTEIFELCENSSKQQVLNAIPTGKTENLWQLWKKYKIFAGTNRVRAEQLRRHLIPGYVIMKNSSRGAKHGPSEQYYQANQMLKKAHQKKQGSHPTILARWYASETYRTSLSLIGWKEKDIMLFDRIALEKHFHLATRAEGIQHSKHWILTLNKDIPQEPLNQRPDFAEAKRECKRLHDEHLARTQHDHRKIPRSQQVRQRKGEAFEGIEEHDCAVDPQTGWRFYKESRRNLPTASSSSSNWDRTHCKTSSWISQHSSRPDGL